MWYMYLKGSSLSEHAVNGCIKNEIHTLEALLKHFQSDKSLDGLRDTGDDVKNEIKKFCHEIVEYFLNEFKEQPQVKNKKDTSLKLPLISDTIEDLFKKKLISRKLYLAFLNNGLNTVQQINDLYQKSGTFLELRQIGFGKNEEALELMKKLNVQVEKSEHVNAEEKHVYFLNIDDIKLDVLEMMLEMNRYSLSKVILDYFRNIIIHGDNNKMPEILEQLYADPGLITGVGKLRAASIEPFLEEFRNLCLNESAEVKFHKEFSAFRISLLTGNKNFVEIAQKLDWDLPFKVLEYVIENTHELKETDRFIFGNLINYKLFETNKGLTYKEANEELCSIYERDILFTTFRVWVKRAKDRLHKVVRKAVDTTPLLRSALLEIFKFSEDYVIVNTQILENINETNKTDFTNLFFNIVIHTLNEEYLSVFEMSNQQLSELAFIRENMVNDQNVFNELIISFRDILLRDSPGEFELKTETLSFDCMNSGIARDFFKNLLLEHNNSITINESSIVFPPTRAGKKGLIDYIIEILEEYGEAIQYDLLVEIFDKKFPEIPRNSYRALKDAMDRSEQVITLGGRSNHYILTKWNARYQVGSVKELIIDLLEERNKPAHYFEIFKVISEGRPELRLQSVLSTLSGLEDVFKSHDGGFYSLRRHNIDSNLKFKRLHSGIYTLIEKNHSLLKRPEELKRALKREFPEMLDIQLDFAISQYLD